MEYAKSYLEKAERRIMVTEEAIGERAYAYCIRQCQEAVELLLKASLRLVGVEPPKLHDVGPVLLEFRDRSPRVV